MIIESHVLFKIKESNRQIGDRVSFRIFNIENLDDIIQLIPQC